MAKRSGYGSEYRNLIASYIRRNYGAKLLHVREEVTLGMTIIGKRRRLDILCVSEQKALGLECKFQETNGTAEEKIPYALDDLAAMRIPGALVYAGPGFSSGLIHLLQASSNAVHCLPDPSNLSPIANNEIHGPHSLATWELDHLLAMTFGWWDLIPQGVAERDEAHADEGWSNLREYLVAAAATRGVIRKAQRVNRTGGPVVSMPLATAKAHKK